MKKIVFLESKKIGYECLNYLYAKQQVLQYEIVGVLTNQRGEEVKKFCRDVSLKLIDNLDEYLKIDHVDIGISLQYHEILKKKHIHLHVALVITTYT